MAHQAIDPELQWRNLIGPRTVVIEYDALPEFHRYPCDPQVSGVDKIGVAELRTEYQRQSAKKMP